MRTYDELEQAYLKLPAPPAESGTVERIVVRKGGGEHDQPPQVNVTLEDGLVGDRWSSEKDPERASQVTLMMAHVANLVGGDPERAHLGGDNFIVDLDLSEAAAPTGTRIRVGQVLLEITEEPHTGCKKFSERLGPDALRWINIKVHKERRLRGVNCRVLEGGEVRVGDAAVRVR